MLYIVAPVVTLIYLFFKKKFSYFKDRDIPHIKPTFPFGNLQGLGKTRHMFNIFLDIYNECRGKDVIAGIYNITEPSYFVTDLEVLKHVTIKDFNNFINRGTFVNEEDEPLTGHLFAIEDDKWRYIRNKLSPAFTSGKIKAMYFTISQKGDNFVKAIEKASRNGTTIDAKNISNRFLIDIVSSCAFGMEANTLNYEHPELVNFFREVFGAESISMIQFFFMMAFPKISKFIRLRQFSKKLTDFFMTVVTNNIKNREDTDDKRSDFLNMLIQLKNKGSIDGEFSSENRKLTLNEILAQAFLFFFAGVDTTSTTISFALTELAFNKDIQEKLRAEIFEKTKDTKGELSYELLQEMPYLNQVVNETLRMYTPGFALIRKSTNEYKIPDSKHVIPKGASVWIPMIGFHYDDRYWNNPNTFDPERFTQEEIAKRPSNVFLPFGDGKFSLFLIIPL